MLPITMNVHCKSNTVFTTTCAQHDLHSLQCTSEGIMYSLNNPWFLLDLPTGTEDVFFWCEYSVYVCIRNTAVHLVASYDIFIRPIYSSSSECSAQWQVLHCKRGNLGCSSVEGMSSTANSGTKATVLPKIE